MAVLGYAARKKHRERHNAGSEQSDKDHMRTRLWNYAYGSGQKNHKHGVVAYPPVDVDVLETDAKDQEHAEGPGENYRKVLADNMVPEVFLYKVIGSEYENDKYDYTESREKHIHPILTEKVYMEGLAFRFVMVPAVTVVMHVSGMVLM